MKSEMTTTMTADITNDLHSDSALSVLPECAI
jgi:hypothetical protein